MYTVDDYVMYGLTGVCQITDIVEDEHGSSATQYYVLHPVFDNNMTIKIPVQNQNALIRPILTKEEVLSLIDSMPNREPFTFDDERQRSNSLKATLKTGKEAEWLQIIKTLYLEKEARAAMNKNLSKADEDIMAIAEKRLHEEFAIALDISPSEVLPFILDQIARQENLHSQSHILPTGTGNEGS